MGETPGSAITGELVDIVASQGWAALMKGTGLRVAKLAPRMAISLAIYEGLQRCLLLRAVPTAH